MKSIKVCEYSRSRSFHYDLILQDQASGERSQDQWSSGYVYLPVLSNDFFSIAAMVSVFKRGLAVFTLHENASMGCFSTASKSKCNLYIRAPFAGSYFFPSRIRA